MKKILSILVVVLILTGCGKDTKTLECSINIFGLDQDVAVKYSGEDIESIELKMNYSADILKETGVTDETMDEYIETQLQPTCDSYKAYDGIDCKVEKAGNSIDIIVTIPNYGKLSDETKSDLGFEYQSYENNKEEFEKSGYTCK